MIQEEDRVGTAGAQIKIVGMVNNKPRVRTAAIPSGMGCEDLLAAWVDAAFIVSLLFWYLRS